jgi:hypothetical protein
MSFASELATSLNGSFGGGLVGIFGNISVYYLQAANPSYNPTIGNGLVNGVKYTSPQYVGHLWAVSGTYDSNFKFIPDGKTEIALSAPGQDVIVSVLQGNPLTFQWQKYIAFISIPIDSSGREVVYTETQSGNIFTDTYPMSALRILVLARHLSPIAALST